MSCQLRLLTLKTRARAGNPLGSEAGVDILTAMSNDVPEYLNLGECEFDHEVHHIICFLCVRTC